jgi:hypothetical protein
MLRFDIVPDHAGMYDLFVSNFGGVYSLKKVKDIQQDMDQQRLWKFQKLRPLLEKECGFWICG